MALSRGTFGKKKTKKYWKNIVWIVVIKKPCRCEQPFQPVRFCIKFVQRLAILIWCNNVLSNWLVLFRVLQLRREAQMFCTYFFRVLYQRVFTYRSGIFPIFVSTLTPSRLSAFWMCSTYNLKTEPNLCQCELYRRTFPNCRNNQMSSKCLLYEVYPQVLGKNTFIV